MNNEKIIWPLKFAPSYCPVFVHNEIHINASPKKIWHLLINAPTWHEWYPNASKIQLPGQHNNHLLAGTKFEWKTFGVNLESEVLEFVPYQRLAWSAKGMGISAWHAWLLVPTKTGCKVITEETQRGWLCILNKLFMPVRMHKYHQIWLQGLKDKSEKA